MKETLILLPGLGASEELWKHQTQHLKEIADPKVIALNQFETRAQMAKAILQNAPERFALAGHSMGGWVAQEVAAIAPKRISKLILLNTWSRLDPNIKALQEKVLERIQKNEFEQALMEYLPRLILSSRLSDKELMESLKAMLIGTPPKNYELQIQAMIKEGANPTKLSDVKTPTLIIYGRQDSLFPLQEQLALKERLKTSKLAIIEECGHLTPLERPQATTALMRLWLMS